ncbi:MAG: 30S ribosomal protein S8 [Gammaproteobacteria bacterium]
MSMSDPIADMLTRIRNGQKAGMVRVSMPGSKMKQAIAKVLKDEGYVVDFQTEVNDVHSTLHVDLKYFEGKPVIESLQRASRPGLRSYKGKDELPKVLGGLGVAIVSTSRGVMTDREARKQGHGGEILCLVS